MKGKIRGDLPKPPGTWAEIFAKERETCGRMVFAVGVIVNGAALSWAWRVVGKKVPAAGVAGEDTTPGIEMSG